MVLEINKINVFQVHRHRYHQVPLVINKQDSSFRVDGGKFFVLFFFSLHLIRMAVTGQQRLTTLPSRVKYAPVKCQNKTLNAFQCMHMSSCIYTDVSVSLGGKQGADTVVVKTVVGARRIMKFIRCLGNCQ